MLNFKNCFTGLLIAFLSAQASATIHPVVSLGVGSDTTNINISQNVAMFAPFQNTYVGATTDTEGVINAFLGAEIPFLRDWVFQLGGAYYQNIDAYMPTGTVYQFGDPAFGNLNYSFNIESRRYLFQTKLLYTIQKYIHPYVTGGAGVAVNRSYGYNETGVSSSDVPMQEPFAEKTTRSFTYLVGAGLEMDVSTHLRFGVGYNYINLGHAALGVSPLQDNTQTLKYQLVNTNQFMMQLSYIG